MRAAESRQCGGVATVGIGATSSWNFCLQDVFRSDVIIPSPFDEGVLHCMPLSWCDGSDNTQVMMSSSGHMGTRFHPWLSVESQLGPRSRPKAVP